MTFGFAIASDLLGCLPLPVADASSGDSSWISTVVSSAVVAGVVSAVLGGLLAGSEAIKRARAELELRSLNEFYAPVRTLLNENRVLRDELLRHLGVDDGSGWHILDNLPAIKSNPDAESVLTLILEVNARIGSVIEKSSGLDILGTSQLPEWEAHRRFLAGAVKATGTSTGAAFELSYFPQGFEESIRSNYDELMGRVLRNVKLRPR